MSRMASVVFDTPSLGAGFFIPDQHRLTEAEHQATFDNDIKPDLFAGAKPSGQSLAVIFGGQPFTTWPCWSKSLA